MVNKIQHRSSNETSKQRIFTIGSRRIEAETDNYERKKYIYFE
jgi:hypothetical protein